MREPEYLPQSHLKLRGVLPSIFSAAVAFVFSWLYGWIQYVSALANLNRSAAEFQAHNQIILAIAQHSSTLIFLILLVGVTVLKLHARLYFEKRLVNRRWWRYI